MINLKHHKIKILGKVIGNLKSYSGLENHNENNQDLFNFKGNSLTPLNKALGEIGHKLEKYKKNNFWGILNNKTALLEIKFLKETAKKIILFAINWKKTY